MTPTLPDTYTIALGRNGRFGSLSVDAAKFAPHIHEYIYVYGLKQVLNDAAATKKDENGAALPDDEIRALSEKKLANLYAGALRTAREATDPVEAEAMKLARTAIAKQLRKANAWNVTGKQEGESAVECAIRNALAAKRKPHDEAAVAAAIDAAANTPAIRKEAERIVRERGNANVDLATLGL